MSELRIRGLQANALSLAQRLSTGGLLLAVVFAAAKVDAGSLFMKNGYVIQGPVVERNEVSVVLGWENGKLTVHRRFIDQVVYDVGEEEQLEEWERLQRNEAAARQEALAHTGVSEDPQSLPAELEDLLARLDTPVFSESPSGLDVDIEATDPTGILDPVVGVADGADGGDEQVPTVDEIPRPESLLDKQVTRSDGAFSLKVPSGWRVRETDRTFEVVAKPVDGQRPSVNVVEIGAGKFDLKEALSILRDASNTTLESWEMLSQDSWSSPGGLTGVELVGRGVLGGQSMTVRQVLVESSGAYWLCSGFVPEGASEEVAWVVEECIRTFTPSASSAR